MRYSTLLAFTLAAVCATTVMAAEATAHIVQVTGQGEATTAPDRARLSVSVEVRNIELKAAETKVNDTARGYLADLKSLGIKDEDIATASYSVNPEYDYVNNQQKFRGYRAVRSIDVTVRDLAKLGDVLLRATKAGINQVNPPVLESSQIKASERAALTRATEDAQAQAKVIAEALSMKLGSVRTISTGTQGYQPPMPMMKVMSMRAASADAPAMSGNEEMGFSGGLIRSNASVTAEFELLP
jgi:uncharacterized protein YggE